MITRDVDLRIVVELLLRSYTCTYERVTVLKERESCADSLADFQLVAKLRFWRTSSPRLNKSVRAVRNS